MKVGDIAGDVVAGCL
jgi:hypothetical protein